MGRSCPRRERRDEEGEGGGRLVAVMGEGRMGMLAEEGRGDMQEVVVNMGEVAMEVVGEEEEVMVPTHPAEGTKEGLVEVDVEGTEAIEKEGYRWESGDVGRGCRIPGLEVEVEEEGIEGGEGGGGIMMLGEESCGRHDTRSWW